MEGSRSQLRAAMFVEIAEKRKSDLLNLSDLI